MRTKYCPFVTSLSPFHWWMILNSWSNASIRTNYQLLPEPCRRPTASPRSSQPNSISPIFFSHTAPLDLCQKQPWHWSDCGAFSGRVCQHTQEQQQLQERDEGFRNHRWARQAAVWTLEWRQRHILEVKTLVEPVVLPAWIPLSRVCIGSLLGWTCFNRANYFTTDC